MPWKNGQGLTAEIAIAPAEAQFPQDEFRWRLSSATVKCAGDFSQFPGCDRWLAVWKGAGFILNEETVPPFAPHRFAGETPIHCKLVQGEVIDVGLIFRRDRVRAEMKVLKFMKSETLELGPGTHFIITAEGRAAAGELELAAGESLRVEGPSSLELRAIRPAVCFHISIEEI